LPMSAVHLPRLLARVCWSRSGRWTGPLAVAALLTLAAATPVAAIPRLDLSGYPPPASGEQRWVIQLSGLLPPSGGGTFSPDPADWRVQLMVGRSVLLDCNQQHLSGELRSQTIQVNGAPRTLWRASGGVVLSTRMACPADAPRRPQFLSLGADPVLLPYRVSVPIVVDAPRSLQVRWRLWKAERQSQEALAL